MEDLIPIKFLEYLEPIDGSPKEKRVRPFMVRNFDKPKDLSQFADNDSEPGKQMLLDLFDGGLIEAIENDILHICNKDWTNPVGDEQRQQWFDTYPIIVKITNLGLKQLEDYRNKHLLNETLKSVKKTNRFQRIYAAITLLAIGVSAAAAGATYLKDDAPNLILIRKSMQRQEQILDSIKQVQVEIDSSLRTLAKKTLPKKKI